MNDNLIISKYKELVEKLDLILADNDFPDNLFPDLRKELSLLQEQPKCKVCKDEHWIITHEGRVSEPCPACGGGERYKGQGEKREPDKLELTLLSEHNTLEYWLTQISLSGEFGISKKMQKRLDWVDEKIEKIAEVNASIPLDQSGIREDTVKIAENLYEQSEYICDTDITLKDCLAIVDYLKSNQ